MTDFANFVIILTVVFGSFGLFIIWIGARNRTGKSNNHLSGSPSDENQNKSITEHSS